MQENLKAAGSNIYMDYDKSHILSKCKDIVLEARRVLLNEELGEMAIMPTEENEPKENMENYFQQIQKDLNFKSEYMKELSSNKLEKKKYVVNELKNAVFTDDSSVKIKTNDNETLLPNKIFTNYLIKKYFNIWKQEIKAPKQKVFRMQKHRQFEDESDNNIKLDKLIRMIKKCKKHKSSNHSKDEKQIEIPKETKFSNNYKHRYNAQKNIIDNQKNKLEEQRKVIEELKLGIIREDLLNSLHSTKISIKEIFSNCSEKVKCKVPILLIEENKKFALNTQKAPKIIKQMEHRALQRLQNRQVILERKRLIEEARQKMLEKAIEKKRTLEEDERRKNLEAIKARRKKELETEKIKQAQKEIYIKKLNKAIGLYNKQLITKCFNTLYNHYIECKTNEVIALAHYETKILQKSMYCLLTCVEEKYKVKYSIADAHFAYKILKKTLIIWHNFYIESIRNMQVAEDIYDFHLTSNTFRHWHRYVCIQIILQDKQMKIAKNHYKRKILLQYYYQWRSLPAVLQLEKAKELKKQKWREKVWEIIPNYKPPEDI